MPTIHQLELEYGLERAAQELRRIAGFVRFLAERPDELRAWAARIESGLVPKSRCLPADLAESMANEFDRIRGKVAP